MVWLIQMPPSSCNWIAYCSGRKMMKISAPNLTTSDTILAFFVSSSWVQSRLIAYAKAKAREQEQRA